MLTLNNLVAKIAEFQTNHLQLKSWFFGVPPDEKSGGNSIRYPMLMGILQPNKITGNSDITVIEFFVLDKVKKDKRNETDVLSDTKLICLDLLTYLKQTKWVEFLSINTDITLNDIIDAGADEVSGWSFQLELRAKFEWDLCSVPITGQPSQVNPQSCFIIDQNGNTLATLPPGSYYTVEVLQEIIQTLTDPAPATIIQTL